MLLDIVFFIMVFRIPVFGCDNPESAVCDSVLHVHGQHEEDVSISDDLEKFEDHSNEVKFISRNNYLGVVHNNQNRYLFFIDQKIEVSSPNLVCDKQDFKEVKETDANGEVTVAEEVSASPEEVQQESHEKETLFCFCLPIRAWKTISRFSSIPEI
ncbi:hypothetical protein Hanom_Chr00s019562g01759121 [Helianthus anomalus]